MYYVIVTVTVAEPVANLQDTLKPRKRLFVCGLCLDVCVLDTCVNAAACGFRDSTYMVHYIVHYIVHYTVHHIVRYIRLQSLLHTAAASTT